MNQSTDSIQKARTRSLELFESGFNCAESVLMGVSETLGYATESLPQIATGFGAGVARYGEICGALAGAAMAIGLAQGRRVPADVEARDRTYRSVDATLKEFKRVHGALNCLELTGCDMRTEEGQKKAGQLNLHGSVCPKYVVLAAELAAREIG